MKIALISDIHGNMTSLQAVLDDIDRSGIDRTICLGDIATLGPEPLQVMAALQQNEIPCIMGNHDEFLIDAQLIHRYTEAPVIADAVDWCRGLMNDAALDYIRAFPREMRLTVNGRNILLFHGSPRSHMEDILATTPADELDTLLNGETAAVMAGGHTHIQMLRQHRGTLLVNPGSAGLPFLEYVAGKQPVVLPYAEYAVIDIRDETVSVNLKRVYPDRETLINRCKAVDFPLRDMLIAQYLNAKIE